MSKIRWHILPFLLLCSFAVSAGIKEEVAKAIVQVKSGNKSSTGFFWKDGHTVLTTLHSLSSNNNIEIRLPGGAWKTAQIKKVYKNGDLIFLDISNYNSPYYLTDYYTSSPATGTEVFTIGYNAGIFNYISKDFKVGLSQGSTLKSLIPEAARNEIKNLGFPSLDTRIIYLEGSLLHGFSGAPIVDMNGKLIGVADGGLENGAADISWCIHSNHISLLESSTESFPSLNTSRINSLFSAEQYEYAEGRDETINYVTLDQFKFKQIKTRSFSQLDFTGKFSSPDGLGLQQLLNLFAGFNPRSFRYDVYLEENTGATIVVPQGEELKLQGGRLVCGDNKMGMVIDLKTTTNMQLQSQYFESSFLMPNITWVPDMAWTYLTPYAGPAGSVIRRKAFTGMYYNLPQFYLFEALAGKGNYFLGTAAWRNNQLMTPYDTEKWARYAIAIQLTTFSN